MEVNRKRSIYPPPSMAFLSKLGISLIVLLSELEQTIFFLTGKLVNEKFVSRRKRIP
jgi:hypothetical protein